MKLWLLVVLAAIPYLNAEITFKPLDYLPGEDFLESSASGVSGDGTVVVGRSTSSSGMQACLWKDGVTQALGFLPGSYYSYATDVSADGSVVVGTAIFENGERAAFSWSEAGMVGINHPTGGTSTYAEAVSSDGRTIVGYTYLESGSMACRWVDSVPQILGDLPGGDVESRALGVSSDGTIIVGDSASANFGKEAFRWTEDGMEGLGALQGGDTSLAVAVSDDGSSILGTGSSETRYSQGFRWDTEGMHSLVDLGVGEIAATSFLIDASSDGAIAVGTAYNPNTYREEAVYWKTAKPSEIYSLMSLLDEHGIDRGGFYLYSANAISADGKTIVGMGTNANGQEQAFKMTLPSGKMWATYPVQPDGHTVNTGNFLGWIDILRDPWIYSYSLTGWLYCPEGNVSSIGAWIYKSK